MTKADFLRQMQWYLRKMPDHERKDVMYDYEEHIRVAMENGSSEEEAVASLGSPKALAAELFAEEVPDDVGYMATSASVTSNVARAVLVTLALILFNGIVIVGPLGGVVGTLIALAAVSFAFTLTPIWVLLGAVTHTYIVVSNTSGWMLCSTVLLLTGLGLMLAALTFVLWKGLFWLLIQYVKLMGRMVRG